MHQQHQHEMQSSTLRCRLPCPLHLATALSLGAAGGRRRAAGDARAASCIDPRKRFALHPTPSAEGRLGWWVRSPGEVQQVRWERRPSRAASREPGRCLFCAAQTLRGAPQSRCFARVRPRRAGACIWLARRQQEGQQQSYSKVTASMSSTRSLHSLSLSQAHARLYSIVPAKPVRRGAQAAAHQQCAPLSGTQGPQGPPAPGHLKPQRAHKGTPVGAHSTPGALTALLKGNERKRGIKCAGSASRC